MFWARRLLLISFLIALYLKLGIVVAGVYLGGLVAAILGVLLLFIHAACYAYPAAVRGSVTLGLTGAAWAITIPFSPDLYGFLEEHLRSLALLIMSLLAAYGAFLELTTVSKGTLRRGAMYIAALLLFLALLETYFYPFKALSDAFRENIFVHGFVYSSDERDILFAGKIRPKVFTAEPSQVAWAITTAVAAAVILSQHRFRYYIGGAALLLGLNVTGSPTMLVGAGVILLARAFEPRHSKPSPARLAVQIVAVLAPVLVLTFVSQIAAFLPFERTQEIARGGDNSTTTRLIAPPLIAAEVIREYPIGGAGIGGRELVTDIVVEVFARFPGVYLDRLEDQEGYAGWANAFFESFVYSGLICGIILFVILIRGLRAFNLQWPLLIGYFFIIFNLGSGFVAMRLWGYFAIVAGITVVAWGRNPRKLSMAESRPAKRKRFSSTSNGYGGKNSKQPLAAAPIYQRRPTRVRGSITERSSV